MAGAEPAEGGEERTGREREGGGTGVMEFQKIPYLFSINGDGGYGTSKNPLSIFNKWGRGYGISKKNPLLISNK